MAQCRLHLTSLVSVDNPTLRRLLTIADVHRPNGYELVPDARDAEIVLDRRDQRRRRDDLRAQGQGDQEERGDEACVLPQATGS